MYACMDSLVKIPQISQACRDMAREMEKVRHAHMT